MVVIADTTPVNYLVLTGYQDLLPRLFGRLLIPEAVLRELRAAGTPQIVGEWAQNPPEWLEIGAMTAAPDQTLSHLEQGERQAIQLAEELSAELLLVDEKAARREAAKRNLRTTGTLGILDLAAEKGLVDFAQSLQLLKEISFYIASSKRISLSATREERNRPTPNCRPSMHSSLIAFRLETLNPKPPQFMKAKTAFRSCRNFRRFQLSAIS